MKFTFKTNNHQWSDTTVTIKYNKNMVGTLNYCEGGVRAGFMVYKTNSIDDGNKNCPWMWVTLRYGADTFDQMKIWLNENIDSIRNTYSLHESVQPLV
jgi:hypothetical protein